MLFLKRLSEVVHSWRSKTCSSYVSVDVPIRSPNEERMTAKIPVPANIYKIPKIFSVLVYGLISPYPTVDKVVMTK